MRTTNASKIILLLISLVVTIAASLPPQNKYTNLKILPKNISESEMDKIMVSYEKALGVECNYCHSKKSNVDELDFASDKKSEKEISRKMMTMTNDINKKYFEFNANKSHIQAVTCYTCHRGDPRPLTENIVPSGGD